jgi:hypothetical protein
MNTKHTPGPWEVRQADIYQVGGRHIAYTGPHHTPDSEYPKSCKLVDEANARLIASAPFLFDEVQRLQEENRRLKEENDNLREDYLMLPPPSNFVGALKHIINCYSMEGGSDTPDFILAEYLKDCLSSWDKAVTAREKWYSRGPVPSEQPPTEDPDGWIKWDGGECPVGDGVMVNYRFRDDDHDNLPLIALNLRWSHVGSCYDIVAYRIIHPSKL